VNTLLEGLNPQQQEAVTHGDGPCLVVAGAGTGKTGVITKRIAYLVTEKQISPDQIVALTFTDKAASEMQERLDQLLDYGVFVTTSTFHSFCNELIRRHAFRIGIDPEARLITEADQIAILREHLAKLPLKYYRAVYNPVPLLKEIARYVEQAKEAQISPEQLLEHADDLKKNATNEIEEEIAGQYHELAECYGVITKLYEEIGVLTYADLLRYTREILESSPLVQQEEQERLRYILIDEYQDTNTIQAEIAYLLAGERANLFVVGDDDQAIYRFRGANVKNILDFKDRFPKAQIITLTENYRSKKPILDAAYRLIQNNNPHRLETHLNISKKLIAFNGDGEPVEYQHYSSGTHESEGVASTIQELINSGSYEAKDIAIIARSHSQLDSFEEELLALSLPVSRAKQGNFFQEPSVVQGLAYLRFLAGPQNSENLFRLLTGAPFSIPGEEIAPHNITARKRHLSLLETLKSSDLTLSDELQGALAYYGRRLTEDAAKTPAQALRIHVNESKWQSQLIEAQEERAAIHLSSLYSQARTFELLHQPTTILSFVEHADRLIASGEDVSVESELSEAQEGITLITAHSSKGLEYPVVFVVNMVLRRFPMQFSSGGLELPIELVSPLKDRVRYEEERRLAYVAMTRARDRLFLSDAERYGANKNPSKTSPFVTEALAITNAPELADKPLRAIALAQVPVVTAQPGLAFPREFTASALETFEENPAAFYEQYVLQVISEDDTAISFGNAVHNTLRDIFNARREKVELDPETAFKRYWVGEGYATAKMRDEEYSTGLSLVTKHLETLPADFSPKYVEETMVLQLSSGVRLLGKVDRIDENEDGTLHIVDYKTGNKEAREADVRSNLPLAVYAAALWKQNRKVREVSLWYLRTGSHPHFTITEDFLREQATRITGIIENMKVAYATRTFPETGKGFSRSRVR
jgi:DNA helicase-2/ATP-dependent DNA helicase PcrA